MAAWYVRFERDPLKRGGEYIDVYADAVDKEHAIELAQRQNVRLALLNSRSEYELVSAVPRDEPVETEVPRPSALERFRAYLRT